MRRLGIRITVRQVSAALLIATWLTLAAYLARGFWSPMPVTEAEAIRLAEMFVAQNGYTDLPVPQDAKLTLESIEYGSNTAERLEFRHATLERRALGAYRMHGGWTVTFRYKGDTLADGKRGVWVDDSRKRIRMFHQDVYRRSQKIDSLRHST